MNKSELNSNINESNLNKKVQTNILNCENKFQSSFQMRELRKSLIKNKNKTLGKNVDLRKEALMNSYFKKASEKEKIEMILIMAQKYDAKYRPHL